MRAQEFSSALSVQPDPERSSVLSATRFDTAPMRYAFALFAAGIAFSVRLLLVPALGDYLPYVTFVLAVAFSAWSCGTGPSILITVISVFVARYWIIHGTHAFGFIDNQVLFDTVAFVLISSVFIVFGEVNHRYKERLRQIQKELTSRMSAANQNIRDLTGQLLQSQDDSGDESLVSYMTVSGSPWRHSR